jgi:hypothetical protein
LLKHIAPVVHGHFNMRGIFTFNLGQYRPALLGLNPLNALLKSPKSATQAKSTPYGDKGVNSLKITVSCLSSLFA